MFTLVQCSTNKPGRDCKYNILYNVRSNEGLARPLLASGDLQSWWLTSCVSVHTSIIQVQYTIHENTVCAGLMWCWVKRAFSLCTLCPSLDGISCHCSLFFWIFISVSIYRWVHPDLWDGPSSASSLWHFACMMYVASPLSISSIKSSPPPHPAQGLFLLEGSSSLPPELHVDLWPHWPTEVSPTDLRVSRVDGAAGRVH